MLTVARELTGCPLGCEAPGHQLPCLVGIAIEDIVDYADSAIWIMRDGAPALTSLHRAWVAA